jgi:hypothetical protein|tara:strand:+ start:385 stop:594 length:210 start_codon:yes stop_codon:yes gene_type:complete
VDLNQRRKQKRRSEDAMKKKLPGYRPYGKSMPKGNTKREEYMYLKKPKKGGQKKPSVSFKGYSYRSYSK